MSNSRGAAPALPAMRRDAGGLNYQETRIEPPLDEGARVLRCHEILDEHATRAHHHFIKLVDAKNVELHEALAEKQNALCKAEAERKVAMSEMGLAWTDVERANGMLASLTAELGKQATQAKSAVAERTAAFAQLAESQKTIKQLMTQIEAVRSALDVAQKRYRDTSALSQIFVSDLKIERRIQARLRRDAQAVREAGKEIEAEMEVVRRRYEKVMSERDELANVLRQRTDETAAAHATISRMTSLLAKGEATREELRHHWDEAIKAMSRRDASLHNAASEAAKAQQRQSNAEATIGALTRKSEEAAAAAARANSLAERHARERDAAAASLLQLNEVTTQLKQELDVERNKSAEYEALCTDLRRDAARKAMTIAALNSKADLTRDAHRRELESRVRNAAEDATARVMRVTGDRCDSSVEGAQRALSEQAAKADDAHAERALMKVRVAEIRGEMTALEDELKIAHTNEALARSNAERAIEERNAAANARDVAVLELNRFKANHAPIDVSPLENTISSLKREVLTLTRKNEKLQGSWLDVQHSLARENERARQLVAENHALQAQLNVQKTVKTKTSVDLRDLERDAFEANMRLTKAHLEVQTLRPKLAELEERNRILEAQLASRSIQVEEVAIDNEVTVRYLKQAVQHATRDKNALARARLADVNAVETLRQKYMLASTQLERVRKEKSEMSAQVRDLKSQVSSLIEQLESSKRRWKSISQAATKALHDKRALSHASPASSSCPSPRSDTLNIDLDIVDVSALRLRIKTLELESQQHEGNAQMLTEELNACMKQNRAYLKQLNEVNHRISENERRLVSQHGALEDLRARNERCERIAIVLEHQLRDLEPNRRIEYAMEGRFAKASASTALMAALNRAISGVEAGGGGAGKRTSADNNIAPKPGTVGRDSNAEASPAAIPAS